MESDAFQDESLVEETKDEGKMRRTEAVRRAKERYKTETYDGGIIKAHSSRSVEPRIPVAIRKPTNLQVFCKSCSEEFDPASNFCPYCGSAKVINEHIKTKTTANFDPINRDYKPWREKCNLPKRNYKKANHAVTNHPWYPTMRQPARTKAPRSKFIYESTSQLSQIVPASSVSQMDGVVPPSEEGDAKTDKDTAEAEAAQALADMQPKVPILNEIILPVAVYYASWLPVNGVVVHMSLIEQSIKGSIHIVRWLRIGIANDEELATEGDEVDDEVAAATAEDDETAEGSKQQTEKDTKDTKRAIGPSYNNSKPSVEIFGEPKGTKNTVEKVSSRTELQVLAVVSNEVGRLIHPSFDEWVDLTNIDAGEYFMANHMQRVLESVAHRVSLSPGVSKGLARHQNYSVKYIVKAAEKVDRISAYKDAMYMCKVDEEIIKQLSAEERASKTKTAAPQIFVYEQEEFYGTHGSRDADRGVHNEAPGVDDVNDIGDLSFDPYIFEFCYRVKINRCWNMRFQNCIIRVSLSYNKRLSAEELHGTVKGQLLSEKLLLDSSRATHINLNMFPFTHNPQVTTIDNSTAGTTSLVPPATVRLEIATLQLLLPQTEIETVGEERGVDEEESHLEELLREANKPALRKLMQKLAGLIRLENTDKGMRYSILGTFSSPVHESRPWPGSELSAADLQDTPTENDGDDDDNDLMGIEDHDEQCPAIFTDSSLLHGLQSLTFDEEMALKKAQSMAGMKMQRSLASFHGLLDSADCSMTGSDNERSLVTRVENIDGVDNSSHNDDNDDEDCD